MPLTIPSTNTNFSTIDNNLNHFSAFLDQILDISEQTPIDQMERFAYIQTEINQQLNRFNIPKTTKYNHPSTDYSLSINWIDTVINKYNGNYALPGLNLRSCLVIDSPKVIGQLARALKPLADNHEISLIISTHPISTKLHQLTDFQDWQYEITEMIQKISASKALFNELLSKDLPDNDITSVDLWNHLPLMASQPFTQKYNYPSVQLYQLINYVYQIVTWLSKIG